jgi:uncharacterized protein YbjT (DUF2867 family)
MSTQKKIAVVGATGRVGHHAVDLLREAGHDVVEISRARGVDVITGEGLDEALIGVEAIIDAATGPSPDQQEATAFFTTAAHNLHAAGSRAGVRRMIVVSIIGTDRYSGGYGAAKVAHEQAALAGPIPARILRASQFHEFVGQLVDWGRSNGASQVPKMRTQLVAARAVAQALVDLAVDPASAPAPAGTPILEIAGPREESLVDAARLLVAQRGEDLPIEAVSAPVDADINEGGGLLPSAHATLAGPTFEEWLATAA